MAIVAASKKFWIKMVLIYIIQYTKVCPESTQPGTMKKIETFIVEDTDTGNIVHGTMTPQSPSKYAPWVLTEFSQSP